MAEPQPLTLAPQESSPADDPAALWEEYERLCGEGRNIIESQAAHDIRMIVQIAQLYECHRGRWGLFLDSKNLQRRPQAKSDFQPIIMDAMRAPSDRTGRAHVLCAVLEEWTRAAPPVPPAEIPSWLKAGGGPAGVYERHRVKNREPTSTRDQRDAAIHKLIELGPLASFDLPLELALDGDYTCLVHLDSIKGKLDIKGWSPRSIRHGCEPMRKPSWRSGTRHRQRRSSRPGR